ncbi:metallophosphoesterase family protein [Aurantivibrio plasticivorans]
MKLLAISDLHLDNKKNLLALQELQSQGDSWLILAGDICTRADILAESLMVLKSRFSEIIWVPGNHELWLDQPDIYTSSVEKYFALVEICRELGVHTPEDEYPVFPGHSPFRVAPLCLLYDYSFRPAHVQHEHAVAWAVESGVLCRDESMIATEPFSSIVEWCQARVDYTRSRLERLEDDVPLILVNHFPLRYDLSRTMRIPRFSIWCGTRYTEDWHKRYNVHAVVSGHLHMRSTDYRDGVRYEEVSLGYPRDWRAEKGIGHYLREILPGPSLHYHHAGPFWKMRL